MPLGELLALAIPLTDAVAAAHARGITHRDLKPDNVMVDEEGRVKVLDFGLAKLKQELAGGADSRLPTQSATGEGRIVGTVAYMSPEQAEGRPVDPRSDVFSLGVLLYEMATGERPFQGETSSALLASILKDTPVAVTKLRPDLPRDLGRILRRALAKDREERLQTARELRAELRDLKADLDSGDLERPASRPPRRLPWRAVVLSAAAILLGAGALVWWWGPRPEPVSFTVLPVTTDAAVERAIALSPDGRLLAFTRLDGDSTNLYVKQIGGGEALRIAEGLHRGSELSWSPDGQEIGCSRPIERDGRVDHDAIVAVPALGGAERRLTTAITATHGLAWSPDGTRIAITDTESAGERDGLFLVSLETGEKRRLTRPPAEFLWGDRNPRFSPDGRTLAFLRASDVMNDIHVVSVEGGEPRRLTVGHTETNGLAWAPDGRSLVFSPSFGRAGFTGLWRVPAAGGEPKPLPFGEHAAELTISHQGRRLAYRRHQQDTDVWRLAGPGASDAGRAPERFLSSTWLDLAPQYSPDGRRIAFASQRSGHYEIWTADAEGTNQRQLTFLEHAMTVWPSWSPDGREIAFESTKQGSWDIYVVGASGGVPRRITTDPWPRYEINPSWSRDGRFVYFTSNREGDRQIWKVPAQGGAVVQVTRRGGAVAHESPDGRSLYYSKRLWNTGPEGLWRVPVGGGEEQQVLEHAFGVKWAVCSEGIAFLDLAAAPGFAIAFYDFSTRQVVELAPVDTRRLWGLSCSPDCRWILYSPLGVLQSDIMLVEDFR
jgi:Tol biopolymer transport system component